VDHRRGLTIVAALMLVAAACRGRDDGSGTGVDVGPTPAATAAASSEPAMPSHAIRPLRSVSYERTDSRRERGRYLTEGVLQCFICHSERDWSKPGAPPVEARKGAGWVQEGTSRLVAANLTPDPETGAGSWTDDMLGRAIREGVGHDGRVLHPQMWYRSFRNLSDEDLASVVVYLRSLPPVRNPLPKTQLARPAPPPEPLAGPVPARDLSDPLQRGRYLAQIADCMGCHTAWEAPQMPGMFGGGNRVTHSDEVVFSANITPAPSGISYYDATIFREVMRTGALRARKLSSIMPWVAFRNMTDEDLDALYAYLRSRRPVRHEVNNVDPPTPCRLCGQTHGGGEYNRPLDIQRVAVDTSVYPQYVGTYRFEDGFEVLVRTKDGKLELAFAADEPGVELIPVGPHEFVAREAPDPIAFGRDASGGVTNLVTNVDDIARRIR
jgi:hypothetical protein